MSLEQIIGVLEKTVNGNQQEISNATGALEQAKNTNFGQMLETLAVVISTETASSVSRCQAALFLKNSISPEKGAEKWVGLAAEARGRIKGLVLNTLATPDRMVAMQVAQAVAAIAIIEIPRNLWPDVIPSLVKATKVTGTGSLQEAAFKALSYIISGMDGSFLSQYLPDTLTVVIGTFSSKTCPPPLIEASLDVLQSMVFLLRPFFQVKEQRDAIVGAVLEKCAFQNKDVVKTALNIISDFMSEYYSYMADYMQKIFEVSLSYISRATEDISDIVLAAIEIWITIAEVEIERAENEEDAQQGGKVLDESDKSRKYVEGALQPLLGALFVPLCLQDSDSDEDDWDMSHAAATCISYIAECVRDKVVPPAFEVFRKNVENAKWEYRNAATVLWGSILRGPSKGALSPYLSDIGFLNMILKIMKDPDPTVRSSGVWTLGRMCESHVDLVVINVPDPTERFKLVLGGFVESLQDVPPVATMGSWGILVLTESLDYFIQGSSMKVANPLAAQFEGLVKVLFASCERSGCTAKQRKSAYGALVALVRCSTPECIKLVANVTVMCLDRLDTMLKVESPPDKKDADELESLISALMTECVRKLESNISAISDRVCSTYLNLLRKGHGAAAQEEAVMGLGAFADALGQDTARYVGPIVDVLKECISKPEESDVCKVALNSLCSLSVALESKFSPYVKTFADMLFPLLSSGDNRSLFSAVFSAFADMAQTQTQDLLPYFPQLMGIIQQAVSCKVDVNDEDAMDFLFDLQESCFTCIAGMHTGLQTLNKIDYMLQFSAQITQCINTAYSNMMRPESLSNAIVGAICDLVSAAGPRTREVMGPGKPWGQFPEMIRTIDLNATRSGTKDTCKFALGCIGKYTGI